nr:MAG TPA: hypothetical protein [Caudoviricetes sp.]
MTNPKTYTNIIHKETSKHPLDGLSRIYGVFRLIYFN